MRSGFSKTDYRPASRFLFLLFVITLLHAKHCRQSSWETYLTSLPTGEPFVAMGPCFRSSQLRTLAKACGDIDAETEKLLGAQGKDLFVDEGLRAHEGEEIARRFLEAKDEQVGGGKDEKDEDEDED